MDLAIGGIAAGLGRLIEPDNGEEGSGIFAQVLAALRNTAARPVEMRRLVMAARLAEIQALALMLRSFRAMQGDGDGPRHPRYSEQWLQAAEQSLGATAQGEMFLAINPVGLSSSWMDVVGDQVGRTALAWPANEWRRRAEAVALADLELTLAPEPIPPSVVHHLFCPTCAGDAGWLDAFAMFLAWQLQMKPHLVPLVLGESFLRSGKAAQILDTAFSTARIIATTIEGRLDGGHGRRLPRPDQDCALSLTIDSWEAMVATLSASMGAPASAVHAISERLADAKLSPGRFECALRQHVRLLSAVHERWCRPEWRDFAPALELMIGGRLVDAAQWAEAYIAETAVGFAEIADIQFLAGRYLPSSDFYGRALAVAEISVAQERLSLKLRMAAAMAFHHLTSGATEAHAVALQIADAVCKEAGKANLASEHLRAAQWVAELSIKANGRERVTSRAAAVATLDAALAQSAVLSEDRIETEAQRILLLVDLAEIDAPNRAGHYEAAEKAARALESLDLATMRPWVRELASAAIGWGLLRMHGSNNDGAVTEAQAAIEAALAGDLPKMDPHLASGLQRRLGDAHLHFAKAATARARAEAAAIAYSRALQTAVSASDRLHIFHKLRQALVSLAKGRGEEWRLCQALAVLNKAEADCPKEPAGWWLSTILLQRSLVWARLRALSKDTEELQRAIADADASMTVARNIKSVGLTFNALRARADVLFEAGKDERDPGLLAEAEVAYDVILSERQALKLSHRDICQTFLSRGEAADLRSTWTPDVATAAEARRAAREAYRQALDLAATHNLPLKGRCESALKKLAPA